MLTEQHLKEFDEFGYFIVDDAQEPGMTGEMRAAARRIRQKVCAGEVDLYTDFHGDGEPYHIVGLNAPEFGEPVFAEYYGCRALLDYVHGQIGTGIRIGPMAMFTNPENEPFHIRWHRDDGLVMDRGEEEEMEYLRQPPARLPLGDGDGRRRRAVADSRQPPAASAPGRSTRRCGTSRRERLPGDMVVDLKAGQTIFWNGDCLHRSATTPRARKADHLRQLSGLRRGGGKVGTGPVRLHAEPGGEGVPARVHTPLLRPLGVACRRSDPAPFPASAKAQASR